MPPPVPSDSTRGAAPPEVREKFSATRVANGKTVDDPAAQIPARACCPPASFWPQAETSGRVLAAPGTVGPLLEFGVLTKLFVETDGVWAWLSPAQSWAEHGPRIRDAIAKAVDLDGWRIEEGSAELLGLIAREVLDGELKSYVDSTAATSPSPTPPQTASRSTSRGPARTAPRRPPPCTTGSRRR